MKDPDSLILDLQPAPVAPLERPQCPFCFRYDGAHNSRCDAATAESKAAPAAPVASHANRHRTLGRRGERAMTDVRRKGRELAIEGAFEKSEQLYPMAGNVPEVVREDRLFRAIYHVWKKNGGRQNDPRVQRMRERWVALTTGVELVKGDLS